ncbi:MAG: hypothetical protein M1835_001115 [Candelina submexicana]|nr:MAG: hypothetical protein M1835_001115 [Candelina submexicana]
MRSLTTHLLSLPPAGPAPTIKTLSYPHSLSRHVSRSLLSLGTLQNCLTQDRIFAYAYIRFIGALLSTVTPDAEAGGERKAVLGEVVAILIDALVNMKHELKGIESVWQTYQIAFEQEETGKEQGPNTVTKGYEELFERVAGELRGGEGSTGWLKALVLLWAVGVCGVEARREGRRKKEFVDTVKPRNTSSPKDNECSCEREVPIHKVDPDPLVPDAVDGCRDGDLEAFVERMRGVVDSFAVAAVDDPVGDVRTGYEELRRECEGVWLEVLRLEERFWDEMLGADEFSPGETDGQSERANEGTWI